jgi:hypothetical protein
VIRWARWTVGLASVVLFAVSLLWALVTPGLRGADEAAHLDSIVRLADGGGWPRPGTVRYEDEIRDVEVLAGAVHDHLRTVFPRTTSYVPEAPAFPDLVPPAPDERRSLHDLDDGVAPGGPIDQMTQHPPGYYAIAAAVYRLTGAGDWPYDSALLLLRALTALMVAATLPVCCFLATRDLTGSEAAGALAAVVPLFVPQLHFVAGTVTNDGATVAATAVVWALLVRVLCAGPTRGRLILLALAVAASCWTKGTALSLLPAVVLALAIGYRRRRGPGLRAWGPPALGATAGVLAAACALGGWWWVVNLVRYGSLQPSGYELPEGQFPPFGLLEFVGVFVRRIRWNFFLEVGGREPPDVDGLTAALAVGFAVLTVAGVFALRRAGDRVVLVVGIGVTAGLLLHTTYTAHLATQGLPGIQGRYLYVLLVPIAALAAAALARLGAAIRLPARWLTAAGAAGGLAVALLGLAVGLRIFYGRLDDTWPDAVDRFLGWAAWPPGGIVLLLTACLLAGLGLVAAAALQPRPRTAADRSSAPVAEPELQVTETADRA